MGVRRLSLGLCLGLVVAIGVTACGGSDDEPEGNPATSTSATSADIGTDAPPEQATAAGAVVQDYLAALKRKDADAGRKQICADRRADFDATLNTAASSFGSRFTLLSSSITGVKVQEGTLRVHTRQSVSVAGRTEPLDSKVIFTMTNAAEGWCISMELPDLGGS